MVKIDKTLNLLEVNYMYMEYNKQKILNRFNAKTSIKTPGNNSYIYSIFPQDTHI